MHGTAFGISAGWLHTQLRLDSIEVAFGNWSLFSELGNLVHLALISWLILPFKYGWTLDKMEVMMMDLIYDRMYMRTT